MRRPVLLLALGAYTLVFAELFIRLLHPQPLMPRYITGTAWGVRGNIPGAHYWHSTPETEVEFRINGQGMRADRDIPFAKPANTCRIELFGDSFFMGYELNLADTFASRLEAALRGRGLSVEVLNLAVSGFGTAEMLRTYEAFGRRFGPDIVLTSWHSGDFTENLLSNLYRLSGRTLEPAKPTYLPSVQMQDRLMSSSVYRWFADNSHVYSFVRERTAVTLKSVLSVVARRRHGAEGPPEETASTNPLEFLVTTPDGTAMSAALLGRMRHEVEADGAGFALVEIPFRVKRHDFRSTADLLPSDLWTGMMRIDSLAAMRAANADEHLIFFERGQGHFTPLGSLVLTDTVVKALWDAPQFARCRAAARPAFTE